jgi:hypothetical protein
MQTMNRRPIKVILLSPAISGALCVVLAIVTGTGTAGAYVFLFLAIPILLLYLMWPERTRFFVGDSAASRRARSDGGRTSRRQSRPRTL